MKSILISLTVLSMFCFKNGIADNANNFAKVNSKINSPSMGESAKIVLSNMEDGVYNVNILDNQGNEHLNRNILIEDSMSELDVAIYKKIYTGTYWIILKNDTKTYKRKLRLK